MRVVSKPCSSRIFAISLRIRWSDKQQVSLRAEHQEREVLDHGTEEADVCFKCLVVYTD
jgi:hypothetical protein